MVTRFAIGAILFAVFLCVRGGVACASAPKAEAAEGASSASSESRETKKGDESATEGLNPVTFRGDLTIWTAVVFLVVLAILAKYAWGPITEGLQKRESEIAAQIAEAQRKNEEARQLLVDYEKKLAAAHDEVRGLIEQGRRDAEKLGQQLLDKAREEAGIERQRAVQQIESATLAALKELAERSATLAVDLAGKIVGSQLKAADHSRLIDQAVTEFSQSRVNGKSHG
jgi:F-type H+-transporting ATPase subunit b